MRTYQAKRLQAHPETTLHLACLNVHVVSQGIYHTNNFLVDDGISGEALLIDATENPARLTAEAESRSLRIVAVVATHSHFDHVGGVAGIKQRLHVPFMIGEHALESLRQEAARAHASGVMIPEPAEPDRLLRDGDWVEVGSLRFQVLYTPGHWRGDICLHEPNAQVVFTGDTLHKREIGRFNKGCDVDQLVRSIRTKLLVLPDETQVYSGHGPVTTIGEARRNNLGVRELLT